MNFVFAIVSPGPLQILIILGLGVLLFGKNLPEIGRNLGRGLLEFKKGLNELKESGEKSLATSEEISIENVQEQEVSNVPKFEPPT